MRPSPVSRSAGTERNIIFGPRLLGEDLSFAISSRGEDAEKCLDNPNMQDTKVMQIDQLEAMIVHGDPNPVRALAWQSVI
ncbi:unnamed protein product [Calypogeia fissa]